MQAGNWKRFALWAAFVAALLAVVNPRLELPAKEYTTLLVFDITQSMNVRDVGEVDADGARPTRLGFAREVALQALLELPCGSKAGIALFTGHRSFVLFVPSEVCGHFSDISKVIESIDWRMAWAAKSEVAKGLHSALSVAKLIGPDVTVAFITDGHEAPPVSFKYAPRYRGEAGEVSGTVIGVGGPTPVAIPKLDPQGKSLGVFGADEVMQIDVFSAGRDSSVTNESLIGAQGTAAAASTASGSEQLSSLREPYLQSLAEGLGLAYQAAPTAREFSQALLSPRHAREVRKPVAIGWVLALLALGLLVLVHLNSGVRIH